MRRREPSGDPRAFVRSFRAIGLTARELHSVLISTIGFYLVVTGIPALVASLIPQSHYGSGIVGQGVVRPAVQLIIGVLILTRRRWGPWREGRGD